MLQKEASWFDAKTVEEKFIFLQKLVVPAFRYHVSSSVGKPDMDISNDDDDNSVAMFEEYLPRGSVTVGDRVWQVGRQNTPPYTKCKVVTGLVGENLFNCFCPEVCRVPVVVCDATFSRLLVKGEWLSTSGVELVILNSSHNPEVQYISSSLQQVLCRPFCVSDEDRAEVKSQPLHMKRVFTTFCIGKHFFGVFIDLNAGSVLVFDYLSTASRFLEIRKEIACLISYLLFRLSGRKQQSESIFNVFCVDNEIIFQNDGHSCGWIAALAFASICKRRLIDTQSIFESSLENLKFLVRQGVCSMAALCGYDTSVFTTTTRKLLIRLPTFTKLPLANKLTKNVSPSEAMVDEITGNIQPESFPCVLHKDGYFFLPCYFVLSSKNFPAGFGVCFSSRTFPNNSQFRSAVPSAQCVTIKIIAIFEKRIEQFKGSLRSWYEKEPEGDQLKSGFECIWAVENLKVITSGNFERSLQHIFQCVFEFCNEG